MFVFSEMGFRARLSFLWPCVLPRRFSSSSSSRIAHCHLPPESCASFHQRFPCHTTSNSLWQKQAVCQENQNYVKTSRFSVQSILWQFWRIFWDLYTTSYLGSSFGLLSVFLHLTWSTRVGEEFSNPWDPPWIIFRSLIRGLAARTSNRGPSSGYFARYAILQKRTSRRASWLGFCFCFCPLSQAPWEVSFDLERGDLEWSPCTLWARLETFSNRCRTN